MAERATDSAVATVAFFGHDAGDSAIRRRVRAFTGDGLRVVGFMMRRRDDPAIEWDNLDLGRTHDAAFVRRLGRVLTGAWRAAGDPRLVGADVIYARNLDMLACAFLARRRAGLTTPVIYECLDVHRLLTRDDAVGRFLRRIEKGLLRRSTGLVVSSPAYLRNHFDRHYPGLYRAHLVENRLSPDGSHGPRPDGPRQPHGPLRVGWVGVLRCRRSLDLLCALAERYPHDVEIELHGVPSRTELTVFEPLIDAHPNIVYRGPYRAPEDLARIYGGLDVVWAGDFMEAGHNSVWLLPNRLYEGGWHGVPPLAPAGTEAAAWIDGHGCGFVVEEPLEATLAERIGQLVADRREISRRAEVLLALGDEVFVQPRGLLAATVAAALELGRPAPAPTVAAVGGPGTGVIGRMTGTGDERGVRRIRRMTGNLGLRGAVGFMALRITGRFLPARLHRVHPRATLHPLYIRSGTSDLDVFGQIFSGDEYASVSRLPEVSFIVDGGANVGYSAAYFLSHYPKATVVSVEPDPENVAMLRRNLAPYGTRSQVIHGALWSSTRDLVLHSDGRDSRHWSRQVRTGAATGPAGPAAAVPGYTIDGIMAAFAVERISILKLDIEGAELELFSRGYDNWVGSVDTFVVELHDDLGGGGSCEAFRRALAPLSPVYTMSGELTIATVAPTGRLDG